MTIAYKRSFYLSLLVILGLFSPVFSAPIIYDTVDPLSPDYGKTITVSYHAYFHPGEYAKGFVKFTQGFTLTATDGWPRIHIDVTEPVDGPIYLNGLALYLDGDLFLGEDSVIYGNNILYGGGSIESDGTSSWVYIPWGTMPIPFAPWQLPSGGGYLRTFFTKEGNTLHALNDLTINGEIGFYAAVLNGHGNNVYFVNSSGFSTWWGSGIKFKNAIVHGAANFAATLAAFEDVTLDMRSIGSNTTSFAGHATIWMSGNNKIIGRKGQQLDLQGADIYLDKDTSLNIGTGIIWQINHLQGKYAAVHFKDKSSTLILDGCTLSLGTTVNTKESATTLYYHEYLQTSLTFSIGTVFVNGIVNVQTPKTTSIPYPWTRGTYNAGIWTLGQNVPGEEMTVPAGFDLFLGGTRENTSIDIIFNNDSHLIAHDAVRINILQ